MHVCFSLQHFYSIHDLGSNAFIEIFTKVWRFTFAIQTVPVLLRRIMELRSAVGLCASYYRFIYTCV